MEVKGARTPVLHSWLRQCGFLRLLNPYPTTSRWPRCRDRTPNQSLTTVGSADHGVKRFENFLSNSHICCLRVCVCLSMDVWCLCIVVACLIGSSLFLASGLPPQTTSRPPTLYSMGPGSADWTGRETSPEMGC